MDNYSWSCSSDSYFSSWYSQPLQLHIAQTAFGRNFSKFSGDLLLKFWIMLSISPVPKCYQTINKIIQIELLGLVFIQLFYWVRMNMVIFNLSDHFIHEHKGRTYWINNLLSKYFSYCFFTMNVMFLFKIENKNMQVLCYLSYIYGCSSD